MSPLDRYRLHGRAADDFRMFFSYGGWAVLSSTCGDTAATSSGDAPVGFPAPDEQRPHRGEAEARSRYQPGGTTPITLPADART